jgi:heterotetrameric sarcosine oxidase delta subunit
MLMVPCPWCGPRNSSDLRYVGESRPRPEPGSATREAWRRYLYVKNNPAGWTTETWYCRSGCRRYFVVERHTVTNEIRTSRLPAAQLRMTAGGDER